VSLQQTAGGSVMTNAGSTPAAPSGSYAAMAREFAANATGNYTVQLAIICDASNLGNSMKTGGSSVWFVPMSYRGRACYRLFFGRYDTQAAARAAVAGIPASLRASSPAVVRVPKG
jgi:septal ring-binding cell division protein DamX